MGHSREAAVMRTPSVIDTIPTQPGGQILESGDTTARGTLTEKDRTGTPAKAAHNSRTRAMRGLATPRTLTPRDHRWGAVMGDPYPTD